MEEGSDSSVDLYIDATISDTVAQASIENAPVTQQEAAMSSAQSAPSAAQSVIAIDTADAIEQANQPQEPTAVVINGITVPYPEGWGGDANIDAAMRRRAGIRWENIARLIVNPRAWYDDSHIMLHMQMTVMHGGQRAAVVDPLYTNLWQLDPAIRHRRLHRTRRNPTTGETEEFAVPVWNFVAGILNNPDIIGIPINMGQNHWVLGIYTRVDHTIRYYNTLWRPMDNRIREQLIAIVERFYPKTQRQPSTLCQQASTIARKTASIAGLISSCYGRDS
jgi:hypothetical protein